MRLLVLMDVLLVLSGVLIVITEVDIEKQAAAVPNKTELIAESHTNKTKAIENEQELTHGRLYNTTNPGITTPKALVTISETLSLF